MSKMPWGKIQELQTDLAKARAELRELLPEWRKALDERDELRAQIEVKDALGKEWDDRLVAARAQIAVLTKAQVEAVDMASEAHRQAVEARAQNKDAYELAYSVARHDMEVQLAEARAQIAAKDAALTKIANYKGTYVGGTIFMAEVARQALAAKETE
jgi:chromosome segregation ATPase